MKYICLILFCLVLLTGCSQASSKPSTPNLIIGSATIQVEVVDNDVARYQGLSNRIDLDKDHGMLFIFDKPDTYGFVMRRMNFPLDIIWLNDNKIVDIKTDLPPDNSNHPLVYYPIAPANYVLEVPAGTAKENGWKIGDTAQIKL